MTTNTLSPQQKAKEKLIKQQRTNLNTTIKRLGMQFSFGNIKTWADVYKVVGYSGEYIAEHFTNVEQSVDITGLREFYNKLTNDLERSINETKPNDAKQAQEEHKEAKSQTNIQPNDELAKREAVQPSIRTESKGTEASTDVDKQPILNLPLSPNEPTKTFLYWFQKSAAAKILQGYGVI